MVGAVQFSAQSVDQNTDQQRTQSIETILEAMKDSKTHEVVCVEISERLQKDFVLADPIRNFEHQVST